jgi:gluconokinase
LSNIVIAVDIGTSSAKGLAVLQDGSVLATFQKSYPLLNPQPGFVEQNPEVIVNSVIDLLKDVIDKSGTQSLLCIAFSSAMHGVMAVDKEGKPLTHLMTWADTRSADQAKKLKSQPLGQQLYEITGTPIHPMSPICKLLWLKENQGRIFNDTFKFVGIKEYLFFKLFGEWVVDFSIASASGLLDVNKLTWSPKALSAVGMSEDRLSKLVSPTTSFTSVKSDQAKRIGLDKPVPFVIGASDGCLANLGSNVTRKGDLAITIGTSGAVRMTVPNFIPDKKGRIFHYILKEKMFVAGGATNNGAALLTWFDQNFNGKDTASFVTEAEKIGPGAEGLLFLPYLMGERAPIYDPAARGVFFGVGIHHGRGHFRRAILEGICFEVCSIVESMKSLGSVKRVIASGGFIKSPFWVQILSDMLGKEILVSSANDASTMGAARLGFEAMGIQTKGEWAEFGQVFKPDLTLGKFYKGQFRLFKSLYDSLKDKFALQQQSLQD